MIRYGLGILAAAGTAAAVGLVACGEEKVSDGVIKPVSDGGGGGTGTGGSGSTEGGAVPGMKCEGACCPTDAKCYSSSAGNGSPGSECLAEADNTPTKDTHVMMRQRWLNITKPSGLTLAPVYSTLNNGTQLLDTDCKSSAQATSGYMQLIDFNLSTGVSTVGFATYVKPADNATTISGGFCMAQATTPWYDRPTYMGGTLDMAIPASELYTATDAGYPEGLAGPMPQPWTTSPTKAKRLEKDFDLAGQSTKYAGLTMRQEFLKDYGVKADGTNVDAEGFTGVFFFDPATGKSHGYGTINWQVIYDATGGSFILVPIREAETHSQFNDPKAPNCVGKYRADVLDQATGCATGTDPAKPDYYPWGGVHDTTSGEGDASTAGYFLITELEQVWTTVLSMSLCVLYPNPTEATAAGWASATDKRCRAGANWDSKDFDGPGLPNGDWCAKTNSAATATCHDAYHVTSFHAFAAAKIKVDAAGKPAPCEAL